MKWMVIDQYVSPRQPSLVDVGVCIGEKRYPTKFD